MPFATISHHNFYQTEFSNPESKRHMNISLLCIRKSKVIKNVLPVCAKPPHSFSDRGRLKIIIAVPVSIKMFVFEFLQLWEGRKQMVDGGW